MHARERIADMRAHKLFTSDLSVSEVVLVREAGFDPVGLVMGTSIYQIAPKIPSLRSDEPGRELVDTTRALYHARKLAMNRMESPQYDSHALSIPGPREAAGLVRESRTGQRDSHTIDCIPDHGRMARHRITRRRAVAARRRPRAQR